MGKVTQLWNPRGNHRLRRYWISFEEQILIDGETRDQTGVLSLRPACQGRLHARLRAMGHDFEEQVQSGNDIAVWINGLKLFIGVKAIDETRMLVAFGIQPGARVSVTLDAVHGVEEDAKTLQWGGRGCSDEYTGYHIGICQTQH